MRTLQQPKEDFAFEQGRQHWDFGRMIDELDHAQPRIDQRLVGPADGKAMADRRLGNGRHVEQ